MKVGPLTVAAHFLPTEEQYVSDVLNYIDHGDPQVRGATAILCGTLIASTLSRSRFHVGDWMGTVRSLTGNGQLSRTVFSGSWAQVHVFMKAFVVCFSGQEIHFLWRTAFPCCRKL